MIGNLIELVEIPGKDNIESTYVARLLKKAPHPKAAKDFMDVLTSNTAKDIYFKYSFNEN
ncbi:substrate-binding domain-containing protein [Dyadobacter sp.]|uniref:substrate-binding domain-containing protein n=1 Tax=Dyadobacter sp. TaxID=1914288 RepID=UPI003F71D7E0